MIVGNFGVAHPIPNNRFRGCAAESSTITNTSSNTVTIQVTTKRLPTDLDRFFGKSVDKGIGGHINKIILGPSTHSSNIGAVETLSVKSASGSVVTTLGNLAYSYNSGNPVTLIGIGLPYRWYEGFIGGGTYNNFPYGSIFSVDGYSDQYIWDIVSATSSSWFKIATLRISPVISNTYYRLSVNYKLIGLSGSLPGLYLYPLNVPVISLAFSNKSSWYSATSMGKTAASAAILVKSSLSFIIPATTTFDRLSIGGIALSHSMHYVSEYVSATLSDIGEYPRLGSVKVRRFVDTGKILKDIDGLPYRANFLPDQILPVTRYVVTYDIHDATQTHLDQLKGLLEMQERGFLINHFPEVPGLPYVLTGKLKIQRRRYQVHDFSRMNFQLVFEEVII